MNRFKKMKQIEFVKNGYDPFIDFIKAYAIICVLLGHTIPGTDKWCYFLWAGMQVPLFILIQTFHFYKKESKLDIKKILVRVIIPFVLISAVTFLLKVLQGDISVKSLIMSGLANGGGYGPGSYYPAIYVQVALLLAIFKLLFRKLNKPKLLLLFLLISEICEVVCSYLNVHEVIYRLLVFRYVFLLYLGWLWVKDGVKVNAVTILLSFLSLISIIYFEYFSTGTEMEPWFFNTVWKCHRWPCYYYVSNGLVMLLFFLWRAIKDNKKIQATIKTISKSSYEIFLVQMSVIFLFKYEMINGVGGKLLSYIVWLLVVWSISIWGGIFLHNMYNKLVNKYVRENN